VQATPNLLLFRLAKFATFFVLSLLVLITAITMRPCYDISQPNTENEIEELFA
jgi:hypothetical protein